MSGQQSAATALSASTIDSWFAASGWQPFPFQRETWDAYLRGRSGLIHATTGAGKTYAAWCGPLIEALAAPRAAKPPPLRVLWLTPLRALAADTAGALQAPLAALGLPWTVETRTGDTAAATRARQKARLPTALVTTPESLCLLLTRADAAEIFADLRCVVVDEWHELLASKRGTQTELCLARLRAIAPVMRTWGLSATLGNLEEALAALVGVSGQKPEARSQKPEARSKQTEARSQEPGASSEKLIHSHLAATTATMTDDAQPMMDDPQGNNGVGLIASSLHPFTELPPLIIRGLMPKALTIDAIIPETIERFPWAGHLGLRLLPQVIEAIEAVRTTLVFTNTRAQTETWYQAILEARPEWAGAIALHHGSLDKATRAWVEQGLRDGALRCVVCTSSLDLGVDFSPVERVIQIGSPKGVARLLQRAGRSGHRPGVPSRVTVAPTNTFELIEVAAARDAVAAGAIERRSPPDRPIDVLVQHMVTVALGGGFEQRALLEEVRGCYSYRDLSDAEWAWALDFVTRGGPALRAYPDYQRVVERDGRYSVEDQRLARRHRMSVGTIVSDASVRVRFVSGGDIGAVEESFVARLKPGDRFILAGKVLEFVRLRDMVATVRSAKSAKGVVPRWGGGRAAISSQLAAAVRAKLDEARDGIFGDPEMLAVAPILRLQLRWSALPGRDELLIERLATREGHHIFVYPFEGRAVHEGLAALLAYRLSRAQPISFTLAMNDYGFELLAPEPAPLDALLADGSLLSAADLDEDIPASLNAAELARRQFREIARVAGLIVEGYPGEKSLRQVQVSAGLLYDVFSQYDPENLLLLQARREVLDRQLERTRLGAALERLGRSTIVLREIERPTPFAVPLLVDRLREKVSSETLADRVRKLLAPLERAAGNAAKEPGTRR